MSGDSESRDDNIELGNDSDSTNNLQLGRLLSQILSQISKFQYTLASFIA